MKDTAFPSLWCIWCASTSVLVNAFKSTSSRLLRKERPDIASRYRDGVQWSAAYLAASTGGAMFDVVKQYVELQRKRAEK